VGIPECFQTEYCLKNAAYWRSGFQLVESFISGEEFGNLSNYQIIDCMNLGSRARIAHST
jgi:hypothetical protein